MRIHNPQTQKILKQDLYDSLIQLRSKRGFNPATYVHKKCTLLNKYVNNFHLASCVVGVSGGIDSAVTLGIIKKASTYKKSPIRKITAVIIPIFSPGAATNQNKALIQGKDVCEAIGIKPVVFNLTKSHILIKKIVDRNIGITGKNWASGQLTSYIRTPALYYVTSLFTQINLPAILCGTTNRDEGAYLGYFGKASDGMVDVQIISDIHKSEVYKVSEYLSVPKKIRNSTPSGDMFDGRTDEEVFGTSYDFVELYLLYLSLKNKSTKDKIQKEWSLQAKKQFRILSQRLEVLHNYNKHKYLGKSPAIHLDVYERAVPGGWTI
jgi:NAD+ synthase (glutamine-hydrolysing)